MFNEEKIIEKLAAEYEEFKNSYNNLSVTQVYNDWRVIGFYESAHEALTGELFDEVPSELMEWLDSKEKPLGFLYDAWMDSTGTVSFDDYSTFLDLMKSAYVEENAPQTTILNASDNIEQDLPTIIRSFAPGKTFLEIDTEKTIVLDKKVSSDIWSFKVYDAKHTYLYDTSATEARLAKDIAYGYIVSRAEMGKKIGLDEQIQNASKKAESESVMSDVQNKEKKPEIS